MAAFFSIIIPLYNKEHFIVNTIQSALDQTFQDFEIIIINDGSTDASLNKVSTLTDSRIKIFTIKNQGVSHARNLGIEKANADYIAFLDADDLWFPNHLEELKNLLETFPDCGLYANAYEEKTGNTTVTSNYKNIPNTKNWKGIVADYFESSMNSNIAWTSAVMVPKEVLDAVQAFNEEITLGAGEDTDLWIKIALQYPVAFNNQVTAIYMLHAENRITNTNTNLRQFIDLDAYEEAAKNNVSLKKYIDLNRFSVAIKYKLADNKKQMHHYLKYIDKSNLNAKQRFLLGCNKSVLALLMKVQTLLRKFQINLSAFK